MGVPGYIKHSHCITLVDDTLSLGEENGAPLGVFSGVVAGCTRLY